MSMAKKGLFKTSINLVLYLYLFFILYLYISVFITIFVIDVSYIRKLDTTLFNLCHEIVIDFYHRIILWLVFCNRCELKVWAGSTPRGYISCFNNTYEPALTCYLADTDTNTNTYINTYTNTVAITDTKNRCHALTP